MGSAYIKSFFTCSIYINGFSSLWLATSDPKLFLKPKCSNSSNCSLTVIHLVKQVFGYLGNQYVISKFYHSLSSHLTAAKRFSHNCCLYRQTFWHISTASQHPRVIPNVCTSPCRRKHLLSALQTSAVLNFPTFKWRISHYEERQHFSEHNPVACRSQWPRGLRHRSPAARLLRLWVRIPPGGHGCLSVVSAVCCQVEVSATDLSLVQRSPTDCGASLCVIKKPRKRGG